MAKARITLRGCRTHRYGNKVYKLGESFPSADPKEIAYCEGRSDIFTVSHITEAKPAVKKAAPPSPPAEETAAAKTEEAVGRPGPAKKPTGPKARKKRVKVGR